MKHCDNMGKCERIKTTVFPPSYLFFTRVFIWFYVILNTLMLAESTGYWSVVFRLGRQVSFSMLPTRTA